MNIKTTLTIYAGGPGSGCNPAVGKCGRKPGPIDQAVGKAISKYGLKNLFYNPKTEEASAKEEKLSKGKVEEGDLKWDPKNVPRHALMESLGVKQNNYAKVHSDLVGYHEGFGDWGGLRRWANELASGKDQNKMSPEAKVLAVERALNANYYKNKPLDLYRGVAGSYANRFLNMEGQNLTGKGGIMDSWTKSPAVAKRFIDANDMEGEGGAVIHSRIPADNVIFSHETNPILHSVVDSDMGQEHEHLILHPNKSFDIADTRKDIKEY